MSFPKADGAEGYQVKLFVLFVSKEVIFGQIAEVVTKTIIRKEEKKKKKKTNKENIPFANILA